MLFGKKSYVVADLYVVRPTVVASVLTCTDIIFLSLFLKQCLVVGILCIKCNVLYGHLIKQETGFHYLSYLYCHQKLVAKNTPISLLTCPWECSLRTSHEASIKVPAGAVSSSEGLMDYGRGLLCRDSHDMLRWSASMAMCAHRNHASWCVGEKCFGKSLGIDVSIDMQTRVQM